MSTTGSERTGGVGLPLVWAASAGATGILGWLLFAISDWPQERAAGAVLLAVALAGLVATGLTRPPGRRSRQRSLAASALFVGGGLAAALVALGGPAHAGDVLLIAGVPSACGLATATVAARARS